MPVLAWARAPRIIRTSPDNVAETEAFTAVWAKSDTLAVSLRRAAFALAVERLAEAIAARGLFP